MCSFIYERYLEIPKAWFTTVFVDTRLWRTKHPWKRFQNFRQSCVLSTDQIEIHQSQPLVWPSDLLYVMLAGCDWWISIPSVDNMYDWQKFWKRFCGCLVFESRISTKTVIREKLKINWDYPTGVEGASVMVFTFNEEFEYFLKQHM